MGLTAKKKRENKGFQKKKHPDKPERPENLNKKLQKDKLTGKPQNEGFEEKWSKSKKKRMRSLKAKLRKQETARRPAPKAATDPIDKENPVQQRKAEPSTGSSALQKSFKARLTGSRFRILNEELYTSESVKAFEKFSKNPDLYHQYHEGFRHQVEQWPVNPVDVIVQGLKGAAIEFKNGGPMVVADFGCGDAELARQLLAIRQPKELCPFKVHSFDLVSTCDLVTACDMAHVPLHDACVDVGVFCLSLMGTNLADFIREAHRVLKPDGRLKIAEVRSRFESKGTEGDELAEFVGTLDKLGFACIKKDRSNKMFVLLELKKNGKVPNKKLTFTAKPCIYKRR